jgi:hypothetical protein
MIDAYIVRDPEGRVIGMSVSSYNTALVGAFFGGRLPAAAFGPLKSGCENENSGWRRVAIEAEHDGYTIKREQVAL